MSYGIDLLQAGGAQAAGNVINEGMGLLLAGPKRKAQMRTARQMQNLQMEGQKEMTDFNMKKQLEMWEATGYGAQVDQMKRAGINPALLYGMGSGGGQTANVEQGNVASQHAGTPEASRGAEGMGLMIGQLGLIKAQERNLDADTKKKEAEAAKTAGVDTEVGKATVSNLAADTENKKAQEKLTRSQTRLNELETEIKEETLEDAKDTIRYTARKISEEIRELKLSNDLSEAQMKDKIKLLKEQISEIAVRKALMWAQKNNTDQDTQLKIQQIAESKARVKAMAEQLMIAWDTLSLETQKTSVGIQNSLKDDSWDFLKDIIPGFLIPIGRGLGGGGRTIVEGFKK